MALLAYAAQRCGSAAKRPRLRTARETGWFGGCILLVRRRMKRHAAKVILRPAASASLQLLVFLFGCLVRIEIFPDSRDVFLNHMKLPLFFQTFVERVVIALHVSDVCFLSLGLRRLNTNTRGLEIPRGNVRKLGTSPF